MKNLLGRPNDELMHDMVGDGITRTLVGLCSWVIRSLVSFRSTGLLQLLVVVSETLQH